MGNYGVFAYAMEPTFFTNAMRQFMEERGKEYGEIRIELLARQREEEEKLRQQFLKQQYSRIKESTKNEDTEK